jgi:integrase/recombinase XerD
MRDGVTHRKIAGNQKSLGKTSEDDSGKPQNHIPSNRELIQLFLADCRTRGLTEKTGENYGSCLRAFFRFSKRHAYEVDVPVLREFLEYVKQEKGFKVSTISMYFSALQSFYEFLEFEGFITRSPLPRFRRRYLAFLKKRFGGNANRRQLISVEEMRKLVTSATKPRDKALLVLLAKTGVRRKELVDIDLRDIKWSDMSMRLKPTPKRTNCTVYFDEECARALEAWLEARGSYKPRTNALFVGQRGGRLKRNGVYTIVTKYARKAGLHNPRGDINEKFTPHCFRHWFTTHLRRSGMPREYIKELRGDARNETMDIYYHIDREDLRRSYLAHIPGLGL